MTIPAELITPLIYTAAALGGAALAFGLRYLLGKGGRMVAANMERKAARSESAKQAVSALKPEYLLVADHEAVVKVMKGEIAELRSTVIALEVRMQALKQRQDHQLEALTAGRDIEERSASFTPDDLVALARQGWAAQELARVAHLSMAEAELLTRLHGQSDSPRASAAR